jgi:hypothetical protein
MKFIRDIEECLVNLELVENIYVNDRGHDYPDRYQVIAETLNHQYILKETKSESMAKGFLRRLYEHHKAEVTE